LNEIVLLLDYDSSQLEVEQELLLLEALRSCHWVVDVEELVKFCLVVEEGKHCDLVKYVGLQQEDDCHLLEDLLCHVVGVQQEVVLVVEEDKHCYNLVGE